MDAETASFGSGAWPDAQAGVDRVFAVALRRCRSSLARRRKGRLRWTAEYEEIVIAPAARVLADALYEMTEELADAEREYEAMFAAELERTWGTGISSLDLVRKAAVYLNQRAVDGWPSSVDEPRLPALLRVHGRSIVIGGEIVALLRAGYPSGAIARWRALHECTVIAAVLHDSGEATSRRYLAHQWVELAALAEAGMIAGARGRQSRDERRFVDGLRSQREAVVAAHGTEMLSDYGWAAKALRNPTPRFADLERRARSRRRRPLYKLANKHVHASAGGEWLAMTTRAMPGRLFVGAQLEGLADIGILTAELLAEITNYLLGARPDWGNNDETHVWSLAMWRLAGEVDIDFRRAEMTQAIEFGQDEVDAILRHQPPKLRRP